MTGKRSWIERAERTGEFCFYQSRTIAELQIPFEDGKVLRAVLVGMLRHGDR